MGHYITGAGASFAAGVAAQLAKLELKPETAFLDATNVGQEITPSTETVTDTEPARETVSIVEATPKLLEEPALEPTVETKRTPRPQEEIQPSLPVVDSASSALDEVPTKPIPHLSEPSPSIEHTPPELLKVEMDDFQPASKKSKKAKKNKKKGKNATAPDGPPPPSSSEHDSVSQIIRSDSADVPLAPPSEMSEEKQETAPIELPTPESQFLESIEPKSQMTRELPIQEEFVSHHFPAAADTKVELATQTKKNKKGKGKQKQKAGKISPQEYIPPMKDEPALEPQTPSQGKEPEVFASLSEQVVGDITEPTKEMSLVDIPLTEDDNSKLWEPTAVEGVLDFGLAGETENLEPVINLPNVKADGQIPQKIDEFDPAMIALPDVGDAELEEPIHEYSPDSSPLCPEQTNNLSHKTVDEYVLQSSMEFDPTSIALPDVEDADLEEPTAEGYVPDSSFPYQAETTSNFTPVLDTEMQESCLQSAGEIERGIIPPLENKVGDTELPKEELVEPADQRFAPSADKRPSTHVVFDVGGDSSPVYQELTTVLPELLPAEHVPPPELPVENTEEYASHKKGKRGSKGRKSITKDEPAETKTSNVRQSLELVACKESPFESQASAPDPLVQDKYEHRSEAQVQDDVNTTLLDKEAKESACDTLANEGSPHLIGGVDAQIDTSIKVSKKQKRKDKKKRKASLETEEQPLQLGSLTDMVGEGSTEAQREPEKLTMEPDDMQQIAPSRLSDDSSKGKQLIEEDQQRENLEKQGQGDSVLSLVEAEPTTHDPPLVISEDHAMDKEISDDISRPPTSNDKIPSDELMNKEPHQNDKPAPDVQKSKKAKKGKKKRQSVTWEDDVFHAEGPQSAPDSSTMKDNELRAEMEISTFTPADNLDTEAPNTSKNKRKAKKDKIKRKSSDLTTSQPLSPSDEQPRLLVESIAASSGEQSELSTKLDPDTSTGPPSLAPANKVDESLMVESPQGQPLTFEKDLETFSIPGSWEDDADKVIEAPYKDNEIAPHEAPPPNDDGNESQISKNKKKNQKKKKRSRHSDWTDENTSPQIEKKENSKATLPESLLATCQPPTIPTEPHEKSIIRALGPLHNFVESPVEPEPLNTQDPFKPSQQEQFSCTSETPATPDSPEAIAQEPLLQAAEIYMPTEPSRHFDTDTDAEKLSCRVEASQADTSLPYVDNLGPASIAEEIQRPPTNPLQLTAAEIVYASKRDAGTAEAAKEAEETLPSEAVVSETVTKTEGQISPPPAEAVSPPYLGPDLLIASNEPGDQISNLADTAMDSLFEQEQISTSSKDKTGDTKPEFRESTGAEDKKDGQEEPLLKVEESSQSVEIEGRDVIDVHSVNVLVSGEIPPSLSELVNCDVDVEQSAQPEPEPELQPNFQSEPSSWSVRSTKKGKQKKNKKQREPRDEKAPTPDEESTLSTPVGSILEPTREPMPKIVDEETANRDFPITKMGKKKNKKSRGLEESIPRTSYPEPVATENVLGSSTIIEPLDEKEESQCSLGVTSTETEKKKTKFKAPSIDEGIGNLHECHPSGLAPTTDDANISETKEKELEQPQADSWHTWDIERTQKGKNKNKDLTFEEGTANPVEPYVDDSAEAVDELNTPKLQEMKVETQGDGSWNRREVASTKRDKKKNKKTQVVQNDPPGGPAPLSVGEHPAHIDPEPQTEHDEKELGAASTKKGKKNKKGRDVQQKAHLTFEPESWERMELGMSEEPSRSPLEKGQKVKERGKEAAARHLHEVEEEKAAKAAQTQDKASATIEVDSTLGETNLPGMESLIDDQAKETPITEAEAPDNNRKAISEANETAKCPKIEQRYISDETKLDQIPVKVADLVGEKEKNDVWEEPSMKKKSRKEKKNKKRTKSEVNVGSATGNEVDNGEKEGQKLVGEGNAPPEKSLLKEKRNIWQQQFDEKPTKHPEQAHMQESSALDIHPAEVIKEFTGESQEETPGELPQGERSIVEPQNEEDDYWPPIDWGRDKAWKIDEPQPEPKPREPDTSSLDLLLSGDEPQPREEPFGQQPVDARVVVGESIGDFDENASLISQETREKRIPDVSWASASRPLPMNPEQVEVRRPGSSHSDELPPISLDVDEPGSLQGDIDVTGFLQKQDHIERLTALSSAPQSSDADHDLEGNLKIDSTGVLDGTHSPAEPSGATGADDFRTASSRRQNKGKKGKARRKTSLGIPNEADENMLQVTNEKPETQTELETRMERSTTITKKSEALEPPEGFVDTGNVDDEGDFWGLGQKHEKKGKGREQGRKGKQSVPLNEPKAPYPTPVETQEKPTITGFTSPRMLEEPVQPQPSGVVASVFPFLERVSRKRPSQNVGSHETPEQETKKNAQGTSTSFMGKQSISTKVPTFPRFAEPVVDDETIPKFEDAIKRPPGLDPIPQGPATDENIDRSIDVSDKNSEPELLSIKDTRKQEPSSMDLTSKNKSPIYSHSPASTQVDVEHSSPVSREALGDKPQQFPVIRDLSRSELSGQSTTLSESYLQREQKQVFDSQTPSSEPPRSIFGGPYGLVNDPDIVITPPRTPLATIKEHVLTEPPRNSRSRDISDVGSRGRVKAARHSASPQLVLGQEHILPQPKSPQASRLSYPGSEATLDIPKKRRPEQSPTSGKGRSASSPYADELKTEFQKEATWPVNTGSAVPASGSPGLRRIRSPRSTELRAASKAQARARDLDLDVEGIPSSSSYDPLTDKGKRAVRGMEDVYEGWGDIPGSPRSPTRPASVRRRRSLQHLQDLESRVDQLVSENRLLSTAKSTAEKSLESSAIAQRQAEKAVQTRDQDIRNKDLEIQQLKNSLEWFRKEVVRLTETNDALAATNTQLSTSHEAEVGQHAESKQLLFESQQGLRELQDRHSQLTAGLEGIVQNEINNVLASKDAEIEHLRGELADAQDKIKELQIQIMETMADDVLVFRDEDYFDAQCQKLCQHVQQWVLRFSKFSDMRLCRLTSSIRDAKVASRFENAILDGSDVDTYLSDRVRRRDVFMSVVMTMVWEYIFTRYLFGMDREQRQKLKILEKQLSDVGPPSAVQQWRATTLALLAQRSAFHEQRASDTEAVVQEIYHTLSKLLPPPRELESTIVDSLRNVMRAAVELSIEMRTQRAEYIMLPPLQPEYNTNGELARKVHFKAALMNERSGETTSNEELEKQEAVVRIVLFPLVVKKCSDEGDGDEEIVVCPAQVLVARPGKDKKVVRVLSGDRMSIDQGNQSMQSFPSINMDPGNVI
ncbi:involucrin repeat protein [Histoplasma capsulatum G186AR]|nr:involucrin repeat protein [Histoplasma capsulatum]QSS69713.1 involucrin repeat protein [Histoplasma capsulatum G186AR]